MKNKINILFILPNFDSGGSEKLVIDIIKNIDKEKFSPVLAVFFSGTYEEEFKQLGLPFYIIHENKVHSKLYNMLFIRNILKKHNIHIVNTHHTSPLIQGLIPIKLFRKTILIHTEHSNLDNDKNMTPKILFLEKLFLKKVDLALGISKGVCDYFKSKFNVPEKKIKKIVNGVNIERFNISPEIPEQYKNTLNINPDHIVLGLFGNLRVEKNHKNLIKAISLLNDDIKNNLKLILCGKGPEEESLKNLTKELNLENIIIFLGVRKDIPQIMSIVDIYCLVSIYEGMPISILEAFAAGKPVVGTNVIGINEAVKDGINGILVESNNPEDLAAGLTKMITDKNLREEISKNNLKEREKYSFEQMIKNYETLFTEQYQIKFSH